jgi:hypothetical protein
VPSSEPRAPSSLASLPGFRYGISFPRGLFVKKFSKSVKIKNYMRKLYRTPRHTTTGAHNPLYVGFGGPP